ncbi:MAG: DUF58 domain-containing protein [Pseudomonadota bacterium]|nr:DUF58 domain-containing protein [Pseudomonadota bacterium]
MLFFKKEQKQNNENGLAVSVPDLIAQQRYLPYLLRHHDFLTSNRAGNVKSAFKGRGMELEEVRAYNFGDDVRDIDWRITARKSEPFTKVYAEEKDRVITVVLDLSASMVFGTRKELKSVTAAKTAALLGWLSIRNKDRFGILIYDGKNSGYFKPQGSLKNLMAVFNKIAETSRRILDKSAEGNLGDALSVLEYHQKGQGTIFILSDFYHFDNVQFKNIAALAKNNKVYCINIFDVLEDIAPPAGDYKASYNGQEVIFNSAPDKFKQEYQKYFAQNRENIRKNCQKFLCKYLEIRTDIPIFKQLQLV